MIAKRDPAKGEERLRTCYRESGSAAMWTLLLPSEFRCLRYVWCRNIMACILGISLRWFHSSGGILTRGFVSTDEAYPIATLSVVKAHQRRRRTFGTVWTCGCCALVSSCETRVFLRSSGLGKPVPPCPVSSSSSKSESGSLPSSISLVTRRTPAFGSSPRASISSRH